MSDHVHTERPCANCGHHKHCCCDDEGTDDSGVPVGCCTPGGCWEWLPATAEQIEQSNGWLSEGSRLGCPCPEYVPA